MNRVTINRRSRSVGFAWGTSWRDSITPHIPDGTRPSFTGTPAQVVRHADSILQRYGQGAQIWRIFYVKGAQVHVTLADLRDLVDGTMDEIHVDAVA